MAVVTQQALSTSSSFDGTYLPSISPIPSPTSVDSLLHIVNNASLQQCDSVIFDFGDVLFTWSAAVSSPVPRKLMKHIMSSSTWFEYEKGNLTEEQAYNDVAREFNLSPSDIVQAFQGSRTTLKTNPAIISLIRDLKTRYGVRIFAMSNVSVPDYAFLRSKLGAEDWSLFDRIFTSGEMHERKPDLAFFKCVIKEAGIDPLRTVFIDDKLENALPAKTLGFKTVIYESIDTLSRQLNNYLGDPVVRAQAWLKANAKKMHSVSNTGVTINENFTSMLILEATGDSSLVDYVEHPRLFNFFIGNPMLTTDTYPHDLDTTSIGLTVSKHVDHETKMSVMDEMLTYVNKDGIIQTYFDPSRPRTDPIVCVNVLTLFYMHGRGHELDRTLDWVYSTLQYRAYEDGTLYYYSGDTFLFFLARLLGVSQEVRTRFESLFCQRIFERCGAEGDAQQLAMRVTAGATVGVRMVADYERLLRLQEEDGSFPMGWAYRYGQSGILLGNKGWTTALAAQAIQVFKKL